MNKNALKKLAMEARERLLEQVKYRAEYYGIKRSLFDAEKVEPSEVFQLPGNGELLTVGVRAQRDALLARMRARGYEQTLEEAAYTWFNRFIALKYMQEKGRLPVNARALPGERLSDGTLAPPELVYQALEEQRLEGIDPKRVLEYLESSRTEALYKYLLIALCNQLSRSLPRMFEPIDDYTELLCPERLLGEDSVLGMLAEAPADSWEDIQVIGWLYQYYNTALKDETFELLKKNVKITKERVGAATQLFTPEWIVRYMVENSLGREFIEGELQGKRFESEKARIAEEKRLSEELGWAYYLPEAEQTAEVRAQLERLERKRQVEEYTVLDPCMGSGHILVYAFDVLMQLYRRAGYMDREAVRCILEKNLYGLDIDERAAQLAYFALMMKACDYDARFLKRKDPTPQPHVQAIREAEQEPDSRWSAGERRAAQVLSEAFADAREYGSILRVDEGVLRAAEAAGADAFSGDGAANDEMRDMAEQARILSGRYDAVITNPPYMGSSGMNDKLSRFVKERYPDSKSDLFAVFIERGNEWMKEAGCNCMVTMQSWMFLSSFERLREKVLGKLNIGMLMHMENMVLGIAFGTAVTIFRDMHIAGYKGTYNHIKLSDIENSKPKMFPVPGNRFAQVSADNFSKIPGSPIAYWVGERVVRAFENEPIEREFSAIVKGIYTGDNARFLRLWDEIEWQKFCKKWVPYSKGGNYRRWYGNLEYVLNWENNGLELSTYKGSGLGAARYFGKRTIVWTKLTSYKTGFRLNSDFVYFDDASPALVTKDRGEIGYYLALLNSAVVSNILCLLSPTLNYQCGEIRKVPVIKENVETVSRLANHNIEVSKIDWDSFETSWDFKRHPMI